MLHLVWCGGAFQCNVPVREAPEPSNDLPVPQGHGVSAWIGPLFEQAQSLCLHINVFAVKPRHQPELTPGTLLLLL